MIDRDKVIEALQYLISGECTDTQFDYLDEIEAAIALLKEQEPVKPTWKNGYPLCGKCGFKLHWIVEQNNYCANCGRVVEWDAADRRGCAG